MLARSQRQAANQAGKTKKQSYQEPIKDRYSTYENTSTASGKTATSLRGSKLRRTRSQQVVTNNRSNRNIDGRDDQARSSRRSSERRQRGSSLPRMHHDDQATRTANSTDEMSTVVDSHSGSLFRADRRQKKVVYTSFSENPFDVLEIRVEPSPPVPQDRKDVVVKVSASTVSFNDCLIRKGICFDLINPTSFPATPGMDFVGNVVAVGKDVRTFKVGDRVAALVRTGGNARFVTVPESDLVEVPRTCDAAEAVCMVSTFMTAYQCLRLVSNDTFMLNGKCILITGGLEPVGQALIQLSFRAGASEVYATAPNRRHRYLRTILGARPLPLDPRLWVDSIKGSMDIVFDGTCSDGLESVSAALKPDGLLVSLGMTALLKGEAPGLFGAPLSAYWTKLKSQIMTNATSYEIWDSFVTDKDKFKLDLEILFHLLRKRFIKPNIGQKISLAEVAEAHQSLEKENSRGEIVCLPWKRTTR